MIIRKAESKDSKLLESVARKIWTEHYTPIIGAAQVEYMLEKFQSSKAVSEQIISGEFVYFMAFGSEEREKREDVYGYCSAKWIDEDKKIYISKLYVASEFRRRGVSKGLLKAVFDEFPNYIRAYLNVNKNNTDSINAYKAMNFEIIGSVVNDIGNGFVMDDYVMELIK